MRNFFKNGLITIALLFVFGAVCVSETTAQITQILKRMGVHYKALKSLRTGVILEKYNLALDELETTEGKAVFVPEKFRNKALRLDWEKPRTEILSILNNQYVLFRPSLKQAWTGNTDAQLKKLSGAKNPLAFLTM